MTAQRKQKLTVKEYVELETTTNTKHEYHNGEVFALAGGSFNHSVLCSRIFGELRDGLLSKNKDCEAFTSEMKLKFEAYDSYAYPDAMVVCGDIKRAEQLKDAVTNPILIVEVLSEGTAAYDRGEKFDKYKSIQNFQEYVLIAQDKPVVEVYYCKPNTNTWQIERYEGLANTISLQSLSIKILMKQLYNNIKFEEEKAT